MGENRWMHSKSFPLSEAIERVYFLTPTVLPTASNGSGKLASRNSGSSEYSSFIYDPKDPAPTPFWKQSFQNGTNEDLRRHPEAR